MQQVGEQGAASYCAGVAVGKREGGARLLQFSINSFVQKMSQAAGSQGGGMGQRLQVECTAADKYFIHFHNFNKIEEIYSRRRWQATKQQQRKPAERKEQRRSRQDKSKKKKEELENR